VSSVSDGQPVMSAAAWPAAGRAERTQLVDQLPRVLAQDHFVRGYVGICDEIWASVAGRLDDLEWYLDVGVAPITFVRWLGRWMGITVDPALPEPRQRALVRTAGRTLMWRGTRSGLQRLLEALTGAAAEVRDGGGVSSDDAARGTQRVTVRLSDSGGLDEQHLRDVIRGEVPANAVIDFELGFDASAAGPVVEEEEEEDSVLAAPEPHGDEGFLPPMRGRFEADDV
jgi:phage tail-like protein